MVREGIVLGHLVSERGIEVDRAKIEVIEQLHLKYQGDSKLSWSF
jgi:hypothetical protein